MSSSTSTTVAPNLILSPESFETSITSARAIQSSSSPTRPSFRLCASFAAWYSAFSERSPCERASEIASMMRGRSCCWRQRSSSRSVANPLAVIGTLFIVLVSTCGGTQKENGPEAEANEPSHTISSAI